MNQEQIKLEIRNIITEIAPDEDLSAVTDEGVLREQMELDSMDFLDIMMELRKRYKIEVPEADYPRFATLKGSAEYLEPLMTQMQPTSTQSH